MNSRRKSPRLNASTAEINTTDETTPTNNMTSYSTIDTQPCTSSSLSQTPKASKTRVNLLKNLKSFKPIKQNRIKINNNNNKNNNNINNANNLSYTNKKLNLRSQMTKQLIEKRSNSTKNIKETKTHTKCLKKLTTKTLQTNKKKQNSKLNKKKTNNKVKYYKKNTNKNQKRTLVGVNTNSHANTTNVSTSTASLTNIPVIDNNNQSLNDSSLNSNSALFSINSNGENQTEQQNTSNQYSMFTSGSLILSSPEFNTTSSLILTESCVTYLKNQLKKATIKFDKACRQLNMLDQQMNDLQNSYSNSLEYDRKTFKIIYRMQLATYEGAHNAYIQYIERQVEKIKKLKRLLFNENNNNNNNNNNNTNSSLTENNPLTSSSTSS